MFRESYLNYFRYQPISLTDKRVLLVHEVKNGRVIKDLLPAHLRRILLLDPNHAGDEGRSRHALIVLGYTTEAPYRIYLLDCYAENSSYEDLVNQLFIYGEKWKIRDPWLETVGAQKWLKYHLEVMTKIRKKEGKWTFNEIQEFKKDSGKDAKIQRIDALEPMFARGDFYCLRVGQDTFIQEYLEYPYSSTRDILDVLGYGMQVIDTNSMSDKEVVEALKRNRKSFEARVCNAAGY
jgi:hypothetical protein